MPFIFMFLTKYPNFQPKHGVGEENEELHVILSRNFVVQINKKDQFWNEN